MADNRPGTDDEMPGWHDTNNAENLLRNGEPAPLPGHFIFPRAYYACFVVKDWPQRLEFAVYYQPEDREIPIVAPYDKAKVADLKQHLYAYLHPGAGIPEAKHLG